MPVGTLVSKIEKVQAVATDIIASYIADWDDKRNGRPPRNHFDKSIDKAMDEYADSSYGPIALALKTQQKISEPYPLDPPAVSPPGECSCASMLIALFNKLEHDLLSALNDNRTLLTLDNLIEKINYSKSYAEDDRKWGRYFSEHPSKAKDSLGKDLQKAKKEEKVNWDHLTANFNVTPTLFSRRRNNKYPYGDMVDVSFKKTLSLKKGAIEGEESTITSTKYALDRWLTSVRKVNRLIEYDAQLNNGISFQEIYGRKQTEEVVSDDLFRMTAALNIFDSGGVEYSSMEIDKAQAALGDVKLDYKNADILKDVQRRVKNIELFTKYFSVTVP